MNTENPAGRANVLVCVTDQPSCRRLILAGDAIAQKYQVPVKVVTVLKPGWFLPKPPMCCKPCTISPGGWEPK